MKLYTLIPQKEKQNIDFPCVPFCIEQTRVEQSDFTHIHDFQQMTIILGGQGEISVNGVNYRIHTGKAYVIGSYIPHCLKNTKDLELVNILFRTEDLLRFSGSLKEHPGFQSLFVLPTNNEESHSFGHILTMDYRKHDEVMNLVRTILEAVKAREAGSEVLVQSCFMILVTLFSRMYESNSAFAPQENEVSRIVSYIRQNYGRPICMTEIARFARVNERKARELFSKEFQCSPMQYLLSVRLKHACYLLKFTDLPIVEISEQVGFEDNNYFSRCFRQHMQMTPSEYRTAGQYYEYKRHDG